MVLIFLVDLLAYEAGSLKNVAPMKYVKLHSERFLHSTCIHLTFEVVLRCAGHHTSAIW